MNYPNIDYKTKTATYESIVEHFHACDNDYNPPLHTYVVIEDYAKKILDHTITFEAWDKNKLIGLAAAYYNNHETKIGFWTNLSLISEYQGGGIASNLTRRVIDYGKKNSFVRLDLEVKIINNHVIKFHEKHGFITSGKNKDCLVMSYNL